MLRLQRASAGSGKTFTLARTYIFNLLTVPSGDGLRLRLPRETEEALPSILAITFTNKATNEMKQRIVEKLAAIAKAADGSLTPEGVRKTDYLADLCTATGTTPQQVGQAAAHALSVLLNDYSDFNVSTIDSFFQSILRTFAYESNLTDSFQVDVETDSVNQASVDATLEEVNNDPGREARFWIDLLVKEKSKGSTGTWNVFQRNDAGTALYGTLLKALKTLESEEFKKVREDLNAYFRDSSSPHPLVDAYLRIQAETDAMIRPLAEERKAAAERMRDALMQAGITGSVIASNVEGRILKDIALPLTNTYIYEKKESYSRQDPTSVTTALRKNAKSPYAELLASCLRQMYEAHNAWEDMYNSPLLKLWRIYSTEIPYMGLIHIASEKMSEILEASNAVMLNETSAMLRRIIGDDDTPFIYERMGTRLKHFLIDEFQDTSAMQWNVLRPLVLESESHGHANLIIGDAKQSIYRFRNADPSLISSVVPAEFPHHRAAGASRAENTNWRSDLTVVEFNNTLFTALAPVFAAMSTGQVDFADLYANVAQYAHHRDRKGYVEIEIAPYRPKTKSNAGDEGEDGDGPDPDYPFLKRIVPLILDMMQRGYRQRDIAILVAKNEQAKDVIDTIAAHNLTAAPNERIDFISDDSLLVSRSAAVGTVVSVLRHIAAGSDIKADEKHPEYTDWNDISTNFEFYALKHPELTLSEQLDGFMNESRSDDPVADMMRDMQAVTLPALVEAITERFVSPSLRRTDAVYLAGLQDMVLDFADSHAADIPTFLEWWDAKGVKNSVTSPEGTDAVQVMTIHKSKGLEFKCVIVPYANGTLGSKGKYLWVPTLPEFVDRGLPPVMRLRVGGSSKSSPLEDTPYGILSDRENDLALMDLLNTMYVAMTRAVDELYVFAQQSSQGKTFGNILPDVLASMADAVNFCDNPQLKELLLPPGFGIWDPVRMLYTAGGKTHAEAKDRDSAPQAKLIEEYGVDSSPTILHFVEDKESLSDPDDNDPRSEGNLLHAIMERVETAADVPGAVMALRMQGLLSPERAREWTAWLAREVRRPEVAHWFDGSWQVMAERSIANPAVKGLLRPDRIMLGPDRRSALVIDYKFGAVPEGDKYRRQVRQYMRALHEATGIAEVHGAIWYVRAGRVEPV